MLRKIPDTEWALTFQLARIGAPSARYLERIAANTLRRVVWEPTFSPSVGTVLAHQDFDELVADD